MRRPEKSIVLVGMMGAGKTSVGKRLASALSLPFQDADSAIEEAAGGRTVSEIFQDYGETEFRALERKVLARLLAEPPHVLATGGGAFIDAETRAAIKRHAISIWLKADVDLLYERVARKDTRPLLRNADPRATLQRLLDERAGTYAEADITVHSDEGPHDVVVRRIISELEKMSETPP